MDFRIYIRTAYRGEEKFRKYIYGLHIVWNQSIPLFIRAESLKLLQEETLNNEFPDL